MWTASVNFTYYDEGKKINVNAGSEVNAPTDWLEAWAKSGLVKSSAKPKAKKAEADS
jgi:hypothetical protein